MQRKQNDTLQTIKSSRQAMATGTDEIRFSAKNDLISERCVTFCLSKKQTRAEARKQTANH
jgi:hypothetical protein